MSGGRDWSQFQRPWPLQLRQGPLWIIPFLALPTVLNIGVSVLPGMFGEFPAASHPAVWMDVIALVSAAGATVGIYMATVSSPGLDTPRLRMLAHMIRRFALFWLAAAAIAAFKALPMLHVYGEAGFIGRHLGKGITLTLGLVYLCFFLSAWGQRRATRATILLACLLPASYLLEIGLLLFMTAVPPEQFEAARLGAIALDLLMGAASLWMLHHARGVFLRRYIDDAPPETSPSPPGVLANGESGFDDTTGP